ncbi:hypothetical protein MASR2M39_23620 [Ignavibacteriales bacterium]
MYKTLKEKRDFFSNGYQDDFIIDDFRSLVKILDELDHNLYGVRYPDWIDKWSENGVIVNHGDFPMDKKVVGQIFKGIISEQLEKEDPTEFYFRGVSEAKYSILTSSKRKWDDDGLNKIFNSYLEFLQNVYVKSSEHPLLDKILSLEGLTKEERVLNLFSLVQHYRGPSSFIDFTLDMNVALHFATEKTVAPTTKANRGYSGNINDYFSLYLLTRRPIGKLKQTLNKKILNKTANEIALGNRNVDDPNYIVFLSDFIRIDYSKPLSRNNAKLRSNPRIVSNYNQNILPQMGVFVINNHSELSLEESLENYKDDEERVDELQIRCFNINKNLSSQIKKILLTKHNIDHDFLFPNLDNLMNSIFKSFTKI